jgi:hypothetical protein
MLSFADFVPSEGTVNPAFCFQVLRTFTAKTNLPLNKMILITVRLPYKEGPPENDFRQYLRHDTDDGMDV